MIIADVATGIASSLVFESLRRPLDSLAAEVRRRDKVGRALNDKPPTKSVRDDERLDSAIHDLGRIIGGKEGALTQSVDAFLRELRRTSLPEAIANGALCGASVESLRAPFATFCGKFERLPFTSDQLFNALYEACCARIEHVKDPAFLEIIRAQHSYVTSKLEQISQSLHSAFDDAKAYSISELREARFKIARSTDAENRYVSVETLRGAKKFKLKSLAIPGRLFALEESEIEAARVTNRPANTTYHSFRKQFDRTVIVGDPGGGKSTLTQMICADQASLVLVEAADPRKQEFDPRDLKIPLKIILRQYEARAARAPAYSLFDYLRDEIRTALEGDDALAAAYLSRALGTGEAIVIFDGLDEVLDVGARRRMVDEIERFAQIYAACPVLVTSRLVGYRDAPLSEQFSVHGLARFNSDEVQKYSEKAIAAVGQIKAAEAKAKAAEFSVQSSRVANDLRENPLMLGLMVQIFVYRGDVPSNRPEVYRECATLMFEKWDGRRQIVADVPRHDVELLDVFGYVASRIFGDATAEEGVSREWLVRELRSHFEGWYVDKASANRAANSLVDFLTGRAWVMSEVGQGVYKFTHRTFLEYFFARNLISESRGIDELIVSDLLPRVIENQWVVIAHLALHMAVFRDGGKSRQAAEALDGTLSEVGFPGPQELAFLRFVSSAMPYLTIPESAYVSIVEKVVERAIRLGANEDAGAIAIIESIALASQQREKLAHDQIAKQLSANLAGGASAELLFSMYVVGAKGFVRRRNIRHFFEDETRGETRLWRHLERVREARKARLKKLSVKNVSIAKAYILVYGEGRAELFKRHGSALLESSISPLVPVSVDMILLDAIEIAISVKRGREKELRDDCARMVEMIAREIVERRLQLDRLLSAVQVKDGNIDRDLEIIFRELWGHFRRVQSRGAGAPAIFGDCLVCLLAMFDHGERATDQRSRAGRRTYRFPAPPDIMRDMMMAVHEPTQRAWLTKFLSEVVSE